MQFFARDATSRLMLAGGKAARRPRAGACSVVVAPAYASDLLAIGSHGRGTQKLDNHGAYSLPFSLPWFWLIVKDRSSGKD
ncbi:hypothetical protein ACRE_050810 [Hapsidospora chrysogenum ATCC 11550]|uniref:Uncharacterized protein n=1 Tax=Hapsidospora chrysogenum (strain ATCC 11550 / CBS 779.69 / DSM 880 / IAM 14645 / JCM 23072 / IMI 49137) TaxID=857340 RepID=A0A086T451_HAPC1|nr:hypothetical protein ACRE_050810 [Hapsidospora chrysogenum ATCC 11550]